MITVTTIQFISPAYDMRKVGRKQRERLVYDSLKSRTA